MSTISTAKLQNSQEPLRDAHLEICNLAVLIVPNSCRLWRRNQDNNMVAADSVYVIRDTAKCANKMYPMRRCLLSRSSDHDGWMHASMLAI